MPLLVSNTHATSKSWPSEDGVHVSILSKSLQVFPKISSGYRYAGHNMDYWGKPFSTKGTIHLVNGADWKGITSFPVQMNKCIYGRYMVRWWLANQGLRVNSTIGVPSYSGDGIPSYDKELLDKTKTGAAGYMQGSVCDEPVFKFKGTSNTVDLNYEVEFWQNIYWWNK